MHQRHSHNTASASVPSKTTTPDINKKANKRLARKKKRHWKSGYFTYNPMIMIAVITMNILALFYFFNLDMPFVEDNFSKVRKNLKHSSSRYSSSGHEFVHRKQLLPLSSSPALKYAFDNSDLVGLYFAASWCPMSTPVTKKLDATFSNRGFLLPPLSDDNNSLARNGLLDEKKPLSILYVSSDETIQDELTYGSQEWIRLPVEVRTFLKRHFQTCAMKEKIKLKVDRHYEIPSLIILDGETGGILTRDGAKDLDVYGTKSLDHWIGLLKLYRKMGGNVLHD